jgi:hypothetical protein
MKKPSNYTYHRRCLILALVGLMCGLALPGYSGSQHLSDQAATPPVTHPSWTFTGSLNTARFGHTATLLPDGKVLVAGGILNSAELYDPATGTWSLTGKLNVTRYFHTATLLPNGKVLVAGGQSSPAPPSLAITNSAELYDPDTRTWTITGNLNSACSWHTATLLPNGNVLVAGGIAGHFDIVLDSAQLYDPATGMWSITGNLNTARYGHTPTLLPSGKVLVAGGSKGDLPFLNSAELYDPVTGTWSSTGNLNSRFAQTATLLPNGKVLVEEGHSAELYDPATGMWSLTGNLNIERFRPTATLLPSGKVLVAGGSNYDNYPPDFLSTELYDPATGIWSSTDSLNTGRYGHTATLLPSGKVLVAGGSAEFSNLDLNSAELYDPPPTTSTFFVPVILSSTGAGGSFYTSEITLANRSARDATVEFTYTAAFSGGSGQATDTIQARQQWIVSDAISYLRQLGIPIPESGSRGGTLRVRFSGLSSPEEVAVLVRTTTAVPEGRAGLAYPGVPLASLLDGPAYLCGLRQDASDRSHVALQNAGEAEDGDITLRLRVFSGNPAAPFFQDLPEVVLPPGGFRQVNGILRSNGLALASGYVRVERVSGSAPYYAYAVIHNQASSDGSFVPPVLESPRTKPSRLTIPVVAGGKGGFQSELVLTNYSAVDKKVSFSFQAVELETFPVKEEITLKAGEQVILPDGAAWLREFGFRLYQRPFQAVTGPLVVTMAGQDAGQLFVGMRVSGVDKGGRYGLFSAAIPAERESRSATWVFGLQQNAESRSNLAVANLATQANRFTIELFDGDTGMQAGTVEDFTVNAQGWLQLNLLLAAYAPGVTQGYARVVPTGWEPFVVYAVLHDGARSGDRTGDGNVINSSP